MHIPDGFLSAPVAGVTYAASAAGVGWALHRLGREMEDRLVPVMGMMTAFIFAAQMLNFPVAAGTSGHFMGGALAVAILGPAGGMVTMAIVLVLQCLLFADGGVTALGANVFNMGIIGCIVPAALLGVVRHAAPGRRSAFVAASVVAAFLAIVLASAACAVELALSRTAALEVSLPAMVSVHILIGAGEAAITAAALTALLESRPDVVSMWSGCAVPPRAAQADAV
jgi:cobalt/nickel transport system permease protein